MCARVLCGVSCDVVAKFYEAKTALCTCAHARVRAFSLDHSPHVTATFYLIPSPFVYEPRACDVARARAEIRLESVLRYFFFLIFLFFSRDEDYFMDGCGFFLNIS